MVPVPEVHGKQESSRTGSSVHSLGAPKKIRKKGRGGLGVGVVVGGLVVD